MNTSLRIEIFVSKWKKLEQAEALKKLKTAGKLYQNKAKSYNNKLRFKLKINPWKYQTEEHCLTS